MSLVCHETGRTFEVYEDILCGTRSESEKYSAVKATVVERIPTGRRRSKPCAPHEGGIDIHEMMGMDNGGHSISRHNGSFGRFLFSVDAETAQVYLPKLLATYE